MWTFLNEIEFAIPTGKQIVASNKIEWQATYYKL